MYTYYVCVYVCMYVVYSNMAGSRGLSKTRGKKICHVFLSETDPLNQLEAPESGLPDGTFSNQKIQFG
jgi:hypothetical protein